MVLKGTGGSAFWPELILRLALSLKNVVAWFSEALGISALWPELISSLALSLKKVVDWGLSILTKTQSGLCL
jgi:hypothetical protein